MNSENVRKAADLMQQATNLLAKGPLDFYLRELCGAHEFLMARCCPFKVGHRVELTRTPEITEEKSWGWMASKHFLVKGAKGTVKEAECGSKGFSFSVEFDDESWLDKGVRRFVDKKHTYHFGESWLRDAQEGGAS